MFTLWQFQQLNITMRNFALAFTILTLLFISFPQLDIKFSEIFYNEKSKFFLNDHIISKLIYNSVPVIIGILACFFIIIFTCEVILKRTIFSLEKNKIIYLFLALILGPGLIVNMVLKNSLIDRARPSQIKEFGGKKDFSPIFTRSYQCKKNCSFTSGHASVGFYFSAFGFIASNPKRRKIYFVASTLSGLLIGLVRIIQGGHFLSDVLYSGIFVFLINYLLFKIIFTNKSNSKK